MVPWAAALGGGPGGNASWWGPGQRPATSPPMKVLIIGSLACGTGDDPDAAVRAIHAGAREFLPLPPDPDLIAAILEAASGESHAMIVRDEVMNAAVKRAEQVARA